MDRTKILVIFYFIIIFTNSVVAVTGTSSSYSASMFGNSIITGNANSNSYSASFLSESGGTTNNALSNSFMSNIGFFESPYFTTVSINSYSISPKSVVIGSTVGLYINANNAQSVWVEINSPNSQTQILNLINGQTLNYLPVPSIVGRYEVVFYANSSTGSIASVADYFDLVEQISTPSQSGSGSSGGSGSNIQSCTYNWDCIPWSLCSNGEQVRTCVNIGTCTGVESKPIESMPCNQALFDISLELQSVEFVDNKIRFVVNLDEKFGVDELDVHLKYSIINSEDSEVFSRIETIAVKNSLSVGKEIELNIPEGDYTLRVDVLYGNLQRAFAEQSFIVSQDNGITGFALIDYVDSRKVTFSVILFVISSMILIWGYYSYRNKNSIDSKSPGFVNGLVGLSVYTDNGMKIGKVYDIILNDNLIYGLAVLIDKESNINYDKVMIRYSYVNNVNDVVVVDSSILEHPNPQSA